MGQTKLWNNERYFCFVENGKSYKSNCCITLRKLRTQLIKTAFSFLAKILAFLTVCGDFSRIFVSASAPLSVPPGHGLGYIIVPNTHANTSDIFSRSFWTDWLLCGLASYRICWCTDYRALKQKCDALLAFLGFHCFEQIAWSRGIWVHDDSRFTQPFHSIKSIMSKFIKTGLS